MKYSCVHLRRKAKKKNKNVVCLLKTARIQVNQYFYVRKSNNEIEIIIKSGSWGTSFAGFATAHAVIIKPSDKLSKQEGKKNSSEVIYWNTKTSHTLHTKRMISSCP